MPNNYNTGASARSAWNLADEAHRMASMLSATLATARSRIHGDASQAMESLDEAAGLARDIARMSETAQAMIRDALDELQPAD